MYMYTYTDIYMYINIIYTFPHSAWCTRCMHIYTYMYTYIYTHIHIHLCINIICMFSFSVMYAQQSPWLLKGVRSTSIQRRTLSRIARLGWAKFAWLRSKIDLSARPKLQTVLIHQRTLSFQSSPKVEWSPHSAESPFFKVDLRSRPQLDQNSIQQRTLSVQT